MPISRNHIKVLIVGVIGVSAIVIYFYRKSKSIRIAALDEVDNAIDLNSNLNHAVEAKHKTFANIAIGRSDVTGSISSKNSMKEYENQYITEDSIDESNSGRLGLKSLDGVIENLESSIFKLDKYEAEHIPQDVNSDSHLLFNEMKHLLEDAYRIREKFKQKLIITSSSYVGSDDSDSSSNDSFVSAREYYQDDSIFEEYLETTTKENKYLFKKALLELENGRIYYRSKRTELVNCQNDTEYLAKLYCLRLGFQSICNNEATIKELEEVGLEVGCAILWALGYETDSFQNAYQSMIVFLHSPNSFSIIKEELSDRGVEVVSLYDILFDFILLDALESLENPPSSLVSVINNRWLSEGFKKTTLSSSIWTILLAKRKFLKYKSGFKAHFYDIMDAIGAPLAWSFLGSETKSNQIANVFKESLHVFIRFMYSNSPRFTTETELAEDLLLKFRSLKESLINELSIIVGDTSVVKNKY